MPNLDTIKNIFNREPKNIFDWETGQGDVTTWKDDWVLDNLKQLDLLGTANQNLDDLHMRPNDIDDGGHWHFLSDDKLKQHWLDTVVDKDDVFAVFDDRQQVDDMWRRNGLTTFQVAEGDF